MKKAIVLGGLVLALTAGSAYAMDHGTACTGCNGSRIHHSEVTAGQRADAAGGGYDEYGRSIGFTPGKTNFKSSNRTYSLHDMDEMTVDRNSR